MVPLHSFCQGPFNYISQETLTSSAVIVTESLDWTLHQWPLLSTLIVPGPDLASTHPQLLVEPNKSVVAFEDIASGSKIEVLTNSFCRSSVLLCTETVLTSLTSQLLCRLFSSVLRA